MYIIFVKLKQQNVSIYIIVVWEEVNKLYILIPTSNRYIIKL